ncbi:thioredoxin-like protein [Baffinella frigidus]|nr:thioredoxin-like protein [Cryptophyta sp. CCMP2293]
MQFSTSWCGHCVKMQPDWEQLAQEVHQDYSGLLVVSVDCEKSADLCQAFQVQGYPTVMLLTATKTPEGELGYQPTPYSKDRTAGPMLAFLREQKACKAKNMFKSLFRFLWTQVKGVLAIQVQMPK